MEKRGIFAWTLCLPYSCDVLICCYLGDNKLMIDGQKNLVDICEAHGVSRYFATHIRSYLATKQKIKGVHILIGGFMKPVLSPFFNILDPTTNSFRFWGEGDEVMEGTTYDNAAGFTTAVTMDPKATGIIRYRFLSGFLGGRFTICEVAQSYKKVYGVKTNLESLGSLDGLSKPMHDKQAQSPSDIYSCISLYINGQTFVKPVSWEEYIRKWFLEQLPISYFILDL
ncbi:hypothetical protein BDV26DRAFT_282038 [Aspergillus bertholletiae]|uniref:NmrA-like domain-containing protein n=1 Tax=Aspergillus bertholletiae TaxID=1226010 RepID=A0A5N7B5A3_9EURO|nr:hypothetical protein BDV26DRAFT_282038 [Aspergillus bertholletiae]